MAYEIDEVRAAGPYPVGIRRDSGARGYLLLPSVPTYRSDGSKWAPFRFSLGQWPARPHWMQWYCRHCDFPMPVDRTICRQCGADHTGEPGLEALRAHQSGARSIA